MNHLMQLELRRYTKLGPLLFGTAAASMLAACFLFALVGRFDDSPDSGQLRSYPVVASLACTVMLCVMAIFGAAAYARHVVHDYVGDRRTLLYLYPGGRRPLFLAKNAAYALVLGVATAGGAAVAGALFFASQTVHPILEKAGLDGRWWASVAVGGLSATALTLGTSIIAGTVGVIRQSGVTAVVVAVVLVALMANGVAASLQGVTLLPLAVAAAVLVVAGVLLSRQAGRIAVDEVL